MSEIMPYKERTNCRTCETPLTPTLSLGNIYVINFGDKPLIKAPLELMFCNNCTLVQLHHTVDPEYLFKEYYYKSGVNRSMVDTLQDIVRSAMQRIHLSDGDATIDIGCNDGTLLNFYPKSLIRYGFEPASNLVEEAGQGGNYVFNQFFSSKPFLVAEKRLAKVITCIAMFYDLDDPHAFLEDVRKCLDPDGIFIIQQNYLLSMLQLNAFDNIVHEHLQYYSVKSLSYLLEQHGLTIEEVEFNDVNGGSFRTYIRHKQQLTSIHPSVFEALEEEEKAGLEKQSIYKEFAVKVDIITTKIHDFIKNAVAHGKVVYIGGASTRGNTLLQVCHLDGKLIHYAVERNPAKWGKEIPWANIKVVSEQVARELPPDYTLILPWHFLGEFVTREQEYLRWGGKLIIPLPKPTILEGREI